MTPGVIDAMIDGNAAFSQGGFVAGLKMMPSRRTIIISCADPRVDAELVLGLTPGEAAVIRNVGGRVEPGALENLALLRSVVQAAGGDIGPGWTLIVMHHTDCGIRHIHTQSPDLLAKHMGVTPGELDALHIADPHAAVAYDVAALKAHPLAPKGALIAGLVYDVATGKVAVVAEPAEI